VSQNNSLSDLIRLFFLLLLLLLHYSSEELRNHINFDHRTLVLKMKIQLALVGVESSSVSCSEAEDTKHAERMMLLLVGWVAYGQDEEGEESLIWVSFFLVGKKINKRFAWDLERERERERESLLQEQGANR
jgi:hypothetical protein